MAGKAPVLPGNELAYALDQLSKNTLIDMVVSVARSELGEDASDESVAAMIQIWLVPVVKARGDKAVGLWSAMEKVRKHNDDYRRTRNLPSE